MKLVSFLNNGETRLGLFKNGRIVDLNQADARIPSTMALFIENWEVAYSIAKAVAERATNEGLEESNVQLLAPVPEPASCRDGYAFRQHVEAARRNRHVPMIDEFDQFPIFYFTNHKGIQGPGEVLCMPDHFQQLDFELEVAIVVCKKGKNFTAAEAEKYIGGYMIMNDMSARTLQMEEMKLSLGPAKGKDFCTVIGPWLVTPDELEKYKVPAKPGHVGFSYNLNMTCSVNGVELSAGNMADMDWTFSEILERCAYGAYVFPGDVIGSGTVGTGCLLELNGTGLLQDPNYAVQWLKDGDQIEMKIDGLGTLNNTIVAEKSNFSLLALKKMKEDVN
ncbi:fumarylacetoacetate hydrolase family protein [Sphingobacterium corticibacter]|uniref:Fumarylacetoacetate hydrolase n=1 Tax=Sphingobacterium corticibacter TaxID=2171749 RepID=A0A2T8HLM8_9SPHI|nr:fumarylacetoacetate hydrolase family protein [Sphingobacterium corticibacter]PVH26335.1 fumarylacetoacetate hydrolase [Sphingobacterium corticibacter]